MPSASVKTRPRIPLPDSKEGLLASATLGLQVTALLDAETPVSGISSGSIRSELRGIAVIAREGDGPLNPAGGDLAITTGWGHAGKGGITMPGMGKVVERQYSDDELNAIRTGAEAHSLSANQVFQLLGETTCDVYLNAVAYWRNVPIKVWTYTIGGYQIIKKWLSYRERELLGRPLHNDEAREVTSMARRIALFYCCNQDWIELPKHYLFHFSMATPRGERRKLDRTPLRYGSAAAVAKTYRRVTECVCETGEVSRPADARVRAHARRM